MYLSLGELYRLLDYIPKETAPDLHEKITAEIVALRSFETYYPRNGKTRAQAAESQEAFIENLTPYELAAWSKRSEGLILDDEEIEH